MNHPKLIEDIIRTSEEEYQLKITPENKEKYTGFLQRQLAAHPEYIFNPQKPLAKYHYCPYFIGN